MPAGEENQRTEPPRFFTGDQVRQLLAECVTVVKPGETLILRLGREWTPRQFRELQDALDSAIQYRDLPFQALAVPADGLGVAVAQERICPACRALAPIAGDETLVPHCVPPIAPDSRQCPGSGMSPLGATPGAPGE